MFVYFMKHTFGEFKNDTYFTNSDNVSEGDSVYLISGDREKPKGKMLYFLEGTFKVYRCERGLYPLKSLKENVIKNFDFKLHLKKIRAPDKPILINQSEWFDSKEFHNYFSSGQNFNPLPAKRNYKVKFDNLLTRFATIDDLQIIDDLDEINTSSRSSTEKEALVNARVGQGRFRSDVEKLWGQKETCALTSIDIPELLIASHIKPWRASDDLERLDPTNGLLLAAHVDKLFDRYLISFKKINDVSWGMHVNPSIGNRLEKLGLKSTMTLSPKYLNPSQTSSFNRYMEHHFEQFSEKLTSKK